MPPPLRSLSYARTGLCAYVRACVGERCETGSTVEKRKRMKAARSQTGKSAMLTSVVYVHLTDNPHPHTHTVLIKMAMRHTCIHFPDDH